MNCAQVLRVDKTGFPVSWLTPQAASLFICADRVLWFHGDVSIVLRGGTNHQGQRSELGIPAIIATQGVDKAAKDTPALSNQLLFLRDNYTCLYCGIRFASRDLSRDHIIPVSRGGADTWTQVVTSCKRCNNQKADRTPEEAGMQLLAVPFVPSRHEVLFLSNRRILGDQMDFLRSGIRAGLLNTA